MYLAELAIICTHAAPWSMTKVSIAGIQSLHIMLYTGAERRVEFSLNPKDQLLQRWPTLFFNVVQSYLFDKIGIGIKIGP